MSQKYMAGKFIDAINYYFLKLRGEAQFLLIFNMLYRLSF